MYRSRLLWVTVMKTITVKRDVKWVGLGYYIIFFGPCPRAFEMESLCIYLQTFAHASIKIKIKAKEVQTQIEDSGSRPHTVFLIEIGLLKVEASCAFSRKTRFKINYYIKEIEFSSKIWQRFEIRAIKEIIFTEQLRNVHKLKINSVLWRIENFWECGSSLEKIRIPKKLSWKAISFFQNHLKLKEREKWIEPGLNPGPLASDAPN